MKRWLVRICVFVVLGAIINVAVAWGCATVGSRSFEEFEPSAEQIAFWRAQVSERAPDFRGLVYVCYVERGLGVLNQTTPCLLAYGHRAKVFGARKVLMAGVPAYCVRGEVTLTDYGFQTHEYSGLRFVKFVAAPPGSALEERLLWSRGFRALPTSPIWPGFAINTVFYAMILWLLFAGPFVLRRRRRIRRGLCPKCAYDLRNRPSDSSACPECGAAVRRSVRPSA